MEPSYKYKPLALGSIRLMRITAISEPLSYEFCEVSLSRYSYYEAVSYSWGDEEATCIRTCEG